MEGQLRMQWAELGNLSKPDGSSLMSQGDTTVQAAVYGPSEARYNKALVDRAVIDAVYRPKIKIGGCAERSLERIIRDSIEAAVLVTSFPHTTISVIVHELQDQGSLLSCAINAACLALMDSGIPMKCLIAAVSAMLTEGGEIVLDPTKKQEKSARALFTFSFESVELHMVTVSSYGSFTDKEMWKCLKSCRSASSQVFTLFRETVSKRFMKEASSDMKQETAQSFQTFHKNFSMGSEGNVSDD